MGRLRRSRFGLGFVIGAAVPVPAVFLALLVPLGEPLLPFLVPATLLLRPLSGAMASWHGMVNVLLVVVLNGVVVGAVVASVGTVLARVRDRRRGTDPGAP